MQEAKFLFETGVGRCDTGEWCWAARGRDMEEFFRDWERLPVSPSGDGWYLFGPYKTASGKARPP